MIWRIWILFGVVLIGGAWVLMVPLSPAPYSRAESAVAAYRAEGLIPPAGSLAMSDSVGHDVFEMPEDDAAHLREAMAAAMTGAAGGMAGMSMPGMKMPGMRMAPPSAEEEHAEMPGMQMAPPSSEEGRAGMSGMRMAPPTGEEQAEMPAMRMAPPSSEEGHAEMSGTGMAEAAKGDHADEEAGHAGEEKAEAGGGHGGGGPDVGIQVIAQGPAKMVDMMLAAMPGVRTVDVAMTEWGYSPANVAVRAGEVVRFRVRNEGRLPHEFMVMTGPGMTAIGYRQERADWNLLEHEAIFERSVVMPGDSFDMAVRIHKPGMWMFMCMFPYHMQLGMMGMIMADGAAGGQ